MFLLLEVQFSKNCSFFLDLFISINLKIREGEFKATLKWNWVFLWRTKVLSNIVILALSLTILEIFYLFGFL